MLKRIKEFLACLKAGSLTEEELEQAERRWPGAKQRYADLLAREQAAERARKAKRPRLVSDPSLAGRALTDTSHPTVARLIDERYSSDRTRR